MKKINDYWFILLAIVIILFIAIGLPSISGESKLVRDKEKERRDAEEAKLLAELEELRLRQEILDKHNLQMEFATNYLNEICEKRYRQLIQTLLILYTLTNVLLFLFVPNISVNELITWNGLALTIVNVIALFFFLSVKKAKEYLKGITMTAIEDKVYQNRDKDYFTLKIEMYQSEISKLHEEVSIKQKSLNDIKKMK